MAAQDGGSLFTITLTDIFNSVDMKGAISSMNLSARRINPNALGGSRLTPALVSEKRAFNISVG